MSWNCVACGNELPDSTSACADCASSRQVRTCEICAEPLPLKAKRCNKCGSYEGIRRHVPFWGSFLLVVSTIVTLISATYSAVVYVADRNSDTQFKVTSADESRIHLRVWNSGRKPSTLTSFRLVFDAQPAKELMLELSKDDKVNASSVITGSTPQAVALSRSLDDTVPDDRRALQYTADELKKLLGTDSWINQKLTLKVDVQESNDGAGSYHTREDRFAAFQISDFLKGTLGAK